MNKRIIPIVGMMFLLGIFMVLPVPGQEEGGPNAPVITQSFASNLFNPWYPWKIYLNASDSSGQMKYIVAVIYQPGFGDSAPSFTRIRKENQKDLSGYTYLTAFNATPNRLNFTNMTLKVWIEDYKGNFSKPAVFIVEFSSRAKVEAPPAGIFKEQDLGPIMITPNTSNGEERRVP